MQLQNSDPIEEGAVPSPSNEEETSDVAQPENATSDPIEQPEADESAVETTEAEASVDVSEPEADASPEPSEESVEPESDTSADDDDDDDMPSASESDEDDDEDEPEAEEESPLKAKKNTLIEGKVIDSDEERVLVDIGDDITGVLTARELEFLDDETRQDLKAGSNVLVFVTRSRNQEGMPVLSISRALEEQDWREAERYSDEKLVYEGQVGGYNKGGLIVRFGRLRGFIPASQISSERDVRAKGESPDQRWSDMLNETIMVKVVEVNRARNRLILSERAAAREYREVQKERLISNLSVGEMRTGRVISLTDFGAFVDLGGADGLIHLTELSWKHVNHPRELLSVGQEVEVKVISVDPDRKRIGLSMKSLEEDPWEEIARQFSENQLVQGKITKLTRFGAFASLMDNIEVEGLIHVSELADYRVEHPRDVVAVGDVLTLRVIKVDSERRRLGLSLKRVNSSRYMDSDWNSWDPST